MQKFYRVAGGSTQLRGVASDIILPSITDNPEFGEAALEHPLPYDEVEPAPIDVANNRKPLYLDDLRRRSNSRVGADSQFQDLVEEMKEMNDRLKNNRISLNEKVRRAELDRENAEKAKEKADDRAAIEADHDQRYNLPLSDVDKPQLKPVEKPSLNTADSNATKQKHLPSTDENPDSAFDDDALTGSDEYDAGKKETLSILADLIDLSKAPRTAGR